MTEWHPFFLSITLLCLHLPENNTYSFENNRNSYSVIGLYVAVCTDAAR
jgi:hypothetical protein